MRRRVRPDAFYKGIVLSNHERLVYSPAGCTPRLSSILLVFLAPIFFLGLDGNIFCAYWYLVDETGVWEEFRQIMSSSSFTRSWIGVRDRCPGDWRKERRPGKYSRDNVTDEEDCHDRDDDADDHEGGVGLVVCHHPPNAD